ncbi:MAG TPA: rhodanese-like domain-containing protein [Acetobacteraceae bacterium]|nr:rhodanese-like domain-containing protein [Acetobacteraceae bacterium]
MPPDSKQIVAQADAATERLSPAEAARLIGDPDTVFVDVREQAELDKTGTIEGAVHVPRGFLEFKADPASPSHERALSSGKRLVLFCASGGRAALAAKTLKELGVDRVAHVGGGGFEALKQAGAPATR